MAILTLRPDAAGDETSIDRQQPSTTYHWDKVDEETPDDNTTHLYTYENATVYRRDLYNLPNHTTESGVINSVKIYIRIAAYDATRICYAKPSQKSGTTITDGTEVSTAQTTYTTFSQTYTTNPATGNAYTWAEIDALQIGLQIKTNAANYYAYCTQVYIEVDYTSPPSDNAIMFGCNF